MIHPDSGYIVSVRQKFSLPLPDNGGIGSVHADAAVIVPQHPSDSVRLHKKQRQTVLPQISPAPSPLSVIVVRQKGAAVYSAQNGLKCHPVQIAVPVPIPRLKADVYFSAPFPPYLLQSRVHGALAAKVSDQGLPAVLCALRPGDTHVNTVRSLLPRSQYPLREKQSPHGLPARICSSRATPDLFRRT